MKIKAKLKTDRVMQSSMPFDKTKKKSRNKQIKLKMWSKVETINESVNDWRNK